MAEVIVVCDRKTIFIKCNGFLGILVLLLSSLSVTNTSSINPLEINPLSSVEILGSIKDRHQIIKKSDVGFYNDGKFSSILSQRKPFDNYQSVQKLIETEVESKQPLSINKNIISQPHSQPSQDESPLLRIPGTSLWNLMRKSFFQPQISRESQNSIFAIPQLKTPKQAWEDLVANAKTGFKGTYLPFQYESQPSSATPKLYSTIFNAPQMNSQTLQTSETLDALRSTRDSAWQVDLPSLAWDTTKVMLGVNKDLISHLWSKHIVQPNYQTFSPLKSIFAKPLEENFRYKTGFRQIYKDKLRDFALLNFLHKDTKASYQNVKTPFFSTYGWSKPSFTLPQNQIGWSEPQFFHHASDLSLFKQWVQTKVHLKKHLLLSKIRLTKDLLDNLPYIISVKTDILKALLHLIAKKDFTKVHHAIKILNHAIWKGKKNFFRVIFKLDEPDHDGYGVHGGKGKGLSLSYGIDLTVPVAHNSHSPAYQAPVPTQTYQVLESPLRNPLYSYPAYGEPPQSNLYATQQSNSYATLPPVVIPPSGNSVSSIGLEQPYSIYKSEVSKPQSHSQSQYYDSFGSGSEEVNKKETFLSKFIKSLDTSTTNKRSPETHVSTSDSSNQKSYESQNPKFSVTLLGTGFSRN